jgi:hypothetical protein
VVGGEGTARVKTSEGARLFKEWSEHQHPRGPDGRFIMVGVGDDTPYTKDELQVGLDQLDSDAQAAERQVRLANKRVMERQHAWSKELRATRPELFTPEREALAAKQAELAGLAAKMEDYRQRWRAGDPLALNAFAEFGSIALVEMTLRARYQKEVADLEAQLEQAGYRWVREHEDLDPQLVELKSQLEEQKLGLTDARNEYKATLEGTLRAGVMPYQGKSFIGMVETHYESQTLESGRVNGKVVGDGWLENDHIAESDKLHAAYRVATNEDAYANFHDAARRYGQSSSPINDSARGIRTRDFTLTTEQAKQGKKDFAMLQAAMAHPSMRSTKTRELYRGVRDELADQFAQAPIGARFRDKGFVSFSSYSPAATEFAGGNADYTSVLVRLTWPKGWPTIPAVRPDELEFLLPLGTVFKITKRSSVRLSAQSAYRGVVIDVEPTLPP